MMNGDHDAFASVLVDIGRCLDIAPRMLPESFGPDGRYWLEELIGVGRDSHVYLATDRHLSRPTVPARVAIKIRGSSGTARTEALVGRSVLHDNVVRIIDHGTAEDGASYVVQEWIEGGSLKHLPLPLGPLAAARLLVPIARGVQALHSAGNVHGDLKPSNILRTKDGTPKITDFDQASSTDLDDLKPGGNVAFMAPERLLDENTLPSPLADVFALGGLLYYFATGRPPYGDTPEQITSNHRAGVDPDTGAFDRDLGAICRRALARDPTDRYRSADAFANDLELWLGRTPIPWTKPSMLRRAALLCRRRPLPIGFAAVALVAIVAAVGWVRVSITKDIEAKRQAVELAAEEVERQQAKIRRAIERFVESGALGNGVKNGASVFEALVWVDWFAETPILDDGPMLARDERLRCLTKLRQSYARRGEQGCMVDGLAAYSLAYSYLDIGDLDAAEAALTAAAGSVLGALPETDDIRKSMGGLQAVLQYGRALESQSAELPALRAELYRLRNLFGRRDGSHSLIQLIDAVLAQQEETREG